MNAPLALKKKIWLTAYLRALRSTAPSKAEQAADDAVGRYERRWSSPVANSDPIPLEGLCETFLRAFATDDRQAQR